MRFSPGQLMIVVAVALWAAVLAAPAGARDMEIGMQDDLLILNGVRDRELALNQFVAMGGTTVRMTVDHQRDQSAAESVDFSARLPTSYYKRAVDAVIAKGLRPQVTLFWRDQDDPELLAAWMRTVVRRLGGGVDRYSVLNEPDLYMPEAHPCTERTQARLVRRFPSEMVLVRGKWRASAQTGGRTVSLERACLRYERGLAYYQVFNPAARAIRRANPEAEILAGETSPLRGLEWFFKGAHIPRLKADAWAHHPFQFTDLTPGRAANNWGIGNVELVKRAVGDLPLYLTEFAYPHPQSVMAKRLYGRSLTYGEVARALRGAFRTAKKAGVEEMLQFGWYRKTPVSEEEWDTALLDDDTGATTPAYRRLRLLIRSWGQ